MLHLKIKNEDKWVSAQTLNYQPGPESYKVIAQLMKKSGLPDSETMLNFVSDFEAMLRLNNQPTIGHINLIVPSSRTTGRLNSAYAITSEPVKHLEYLIAICAQWAKIDAIVEPVIKQVLNQYKLTVNGVLYAALYEGHKDLTKEEISALSEFENSYYKKDMKKVTKSLERILVQLKASEIETVEQRVENAYIKKPAWAIFAEIDSDSGYIDKAGRVGEISAARLFDSESDALTTAGRKRLHSFEIMEVSISLKKRTGQKPEFQNQKMLAALAYMEREKIDNLISELGEEVLTQALQKRKTNKL